MSEKKTNVHNHDKGSSHNIDLRTICMEPIDDARQLLNIQKPLYVHAEAESAELLKQSEVMRRRLRVWTTNLLSPDLCDQIIKKSNQIGYSSSNHDGYMTDILSLRSDRNGGALYATKLRSDPFLWKTLCAIHCQAIEIIKEVYGKSCECAPLDWKITDEELALCREEEEHQLSQTSFKSAGPLLPLTNVLAVDRADQDDIIQTTMSHGLAKYGDNARNEGDVLHGKMKSRGPSSASVTYMGTENTLTSYVPHSSSEPSSCITRNNIKQDKTEPDALSIKAKPAASTRTGSEASLRTLALGTRDAPFTIDSDSDEDMVPEKDYGNEKYSRSGSIDTNHLLDACKQPKQSIQKLKFLQEASEKLDLQRKNAIKIAANDIFLARYNSEKCPGLQGHRDGSWFSYVLHLGGDGHDGGTKFWNILKNSKLVHNIGDLSVHNGQAKHGAASVVNGERYVFVGFVKLADRAPLPDVKDTFSDDLQGDMDACWQHLDEVARHAACCKCGREDNATEMLLCDSCHASGATHTFCCTPKLRQLPEDDDVWYCDACVALGKRCSIRSVVTQVQTVAQKSTRCSRTVQDCHLRKKASVKHPPKKKQRTSSGSSKSASPSNSLDNNSHNTDEDDASELFTSENEDTDGCSTTTSDSEVEISHISRHRGCLEQNIKCLSFLTHFMDGDVQWIPHSEVYNTVQFELYCRRHACTRVALLLELDAELTACAELSHVSKAASLTSNGTSTRDCDLMKITLSSNVPADQMDAVANSGPSIKSQSRKTFQQSCMLRKFINSLSVTQRVRDMQLPDEGMSCWISLFAFNANGDYDRLLKKLLMLRPWNESRDVEHWVKGVVTKVTEKQLEITIPLFSNLRVGWDQLTLAKYLQTTWPSNNEKGIEHKNKMAAKNHIIIQHIQFDEELAKTYHKFVKKVST